MDAAMNVRLGAKTKEFNRKMQSASRRLKKFGKSVGAVGRGMTTMFTMPILLAGAASVKLSLDFQKSMTKIQTLVGKTGEEIETMKSGIMEMSTKTAKSPVELAEGLYFLESAGLRGANAMETLEQVAKGSASGLGDMEALSVVAAAAQNAYGEETLSATEALDKFGVMVRTGMFDAQELSNVLGRQLGLASTLGISFDEVGALISTYTSTTGDATAATNGLSAIMMTFAKLESEPTAKQAEALDKIKMSADDVKKMMGEKGLMATMQHLQTEFTAVGVPMADFFTKSQALKASLGVLGSQTETYVSNLEAMTKSSEDAGFVNEAFGVTAEQSAFKMEQAMNNLKVAGTSLGDSLAPVVAAISEKIMALTEWWNGLDESTQDNYASWLIWIATVGPALMILGKIITGFGSFIMLMKKYKVIQTIATAAQWLWNVALTSNPIGAIILLVAALIGAIIYFATSNSKVAIKVRNAFKWLANGIIEAINFIITGINIFGGAFGFTIPLIKKFEMEVVDSVENTGDAIEDTSGKVDELGKNIKKLPKDANIDITTTGGGGDEDSDAKKAREKREAAEARSLENIRKLKQQFNVLNEDDKQKSELIALKNQRVNALRGVADTKYAEQEKQAINDKFDKKKKALLDKHIEDNNKAADKVKTAWEQTLQDIEEGWTAVMDFANQVFGKITELMDAQANKTAVELENKQIAEQTEYDEWYQGELNRIEETITFETEKEDAMAELDKRAAERKATLDKKQDEEQKKLQKKAAQREKKLNIFNAIVNTGSAVVKALASAPPPLNFILAAAVGIAGAMQIAAIASTPIPMAKGGLAFGPTNALVGEYSGAKNNPEVIAPLDKLQGMLGGSSKSIVKLRGELLGNNIFLSNEKTTTDRLRFI